MNYLITLIVVGFSSFALSCEVCGCATASSSIGTIGASKYHFLGVNVQGRYFKSTHPSLFTNEMERSEELFLASSLIGKYQVTNRLQLIGAVPFHFNTQQKDEKTTSKNGIGDIVFSARYAFIYKADSINKSALIVQGGAGLKLPTGEYSKDAHQTSNIFPGTGSWDFPLDLNLFWIKNTWMLQVENTYSLKTNNKIAYQFGNSFQSTIYTAKTWGIGKLKISPGIGVQNEYLSKDSIDGSSKNTMNGGTLISGTTGFNIERNAFFIIARYVQPLYQNLSKGNTKNLGQATVSVLYTFKK